MRMIDGTDIFVYQHPRCVRRPGGRVVMQRFAKPCTSVQFRSGPPSDAPNKNFIDAINPSTRAVSNDWSNKKPEHPIAFYPI